MHPSRSNHYLKIHKGNQRPSRILFVDTEATFIVESPTIDRHELKLGVALHRRRHTNGKWYGDNYRTFHTVDQFWNIVDDVVVKKTRLYIVAHKMSYDSRILDTINKLAERGWTLKGAVLEDPPFWLEARREGCRITMLCSVNLIPATLREIGKVHGLKKGYWENADADINELEAYCRQDVNILKHGVEGWIKFIHDNDFGAFKPTLASQAFTTYRHRFMKHKILIDNNVRACALSRAAYYGGCTQAFYIGKQTGKFWMLDFNSMYPYVMREQLYPTRLVGHRRHPDLNDLEFSLRKYAVTALVTVTTPKPYLPLRVRSQADIEAIRAKIPHKTTRADIHDRLLFPTGTFRTVLSTPELLEALTNGHITKVHEFAYYEQAPIFRDYVDAMYKLRLKYKKAGNKAYDTFVKLLLNSLYGKFGQRGRYWEDVDQTGKFGLGVEIEINAQTREVTRRRQLGHLLQEQVDFGESQYSHPAIAAHVTAYGRSYLWQINYMAGLENVFYNDTDSVLVSEAGYTNLKHMIDDDRLGALGIELFCDSIEINGPKDYVLGPKWRSKGIKPQHIWLDPKTVEMTKWHGYRADILEGRHLAPRTEKITKVLKRQYNKGLVLPDGRVEPFKLNRA